MRKSVTEYVFSNDLGYSYKHESFTKKGGDGVCAVVSFW